MVALFNFLGSNYLYLFLISLFFSVLFVMLTIITYKNCSVVLRLATAFTLLLNCFITYAYVCSPINWTKIFPFSTLAVVGSIVLVVSSIIALIAFYYIVSLRHKEILSRTATRNWIVAQEVQTRYIMADKQEVLKRGYVFAFISLLMCQYTNISYFITNSLLKK